jgi:hypothetical protein
VVSQVTLAAELSNLVDGVYTPGYPIHNSYNDINGMAGGLLAAAGPFSALFSGALPDPSNPSGPTYSPTGITNTVDSNPEGDNPFGANLFSDVPGLPGLSSIPGVSALFGGSL